MSAKVEVGLADDSRGSVVSALWFFGWLFSIGYFDLGFWKGVFGIIIWPCYVGSHIAGL